MMKIFCRVCVGGLFCLFNSGISYGTAAIYDRGSVSEVLTFPQIPERGIILNKFKDKKDEFMDLTPDKWCSDYQSWQQSVRKLAENCHNDFVSESDGYSRRWNRSMNRFFRLYDGTWTPAEFEEAKSELKRIIDLEDVDPVLKEALSGHCRALGVLEKIDFSQDD